MMQQLHFWVLDQKNQNQGISRDTCTFVLMEAPFPIAPKWKHPNVVGNVCISVQSSEWCC